MSAHTLHRFASLCLLMVVISFLQSCKKNELATDPVPFTTPFTGITETDSTKPDPIGSIDTDDWKPLMDCPSTQGTLIHISDTVILTMPGCTFIHPAFPNPAKKYSTINFCISDPDSVVLTLNNSPATVVRELLNQRLKAGCYSVCLSVSNLPPAIYRVYITVYHQADVLRSYGDVQVIH